MTFLISYELISDDAAAAADAALMTVGPSEWLHLSIVLSGFEMRFQVENEKFQLVDSDIHLNSNLSFYICLWPSEIFPLNSFASTLKMTHMRKLPISLHHFELNFIALHIFNS